VLKPQELILTLVGEYVEPQERVWSGGLVRLLEDLDFTTAGARIAINRVVSRGLFDSVKEGRRVYYTRTPKLTEVLTEGHRQTFWFRYPAEEWDGRWTLVWYAIPEEHLLARRRFSRRLAFLGFGALQDGTWIAPHDRSADILTASDSLDVQRYVLVFVGEAPDWLNLPDVLGHAWDVEEAGRRYAAFLDEFGHFRRKQARARLSPRDAFVARTHMIEAFRQVAPLDPKLPDSVLDLRHRRKAIATFDEVEAALRPAAAQYFAEMTDPNA
jgi:phenylacetic acid degradation operon negative regulatory protein